MAKECPHSPTLYYQSSRCCGLAFLFDNPPECCLRRLQKECDQALITATIGPEDADYIKRLKKMGFRKFIRFMNSGSGNMLTLWVYKGRNKRWYG